ncbi:MAG: site-2 protease family protein [Pirellulales bacterium]|nr:site-2 protease family protein [Pirellulales bacterium]
MHLIAATGGFDFMYYVEYLLVILEVAFALGAVIFVHELGHFAVAKWCGVKCEKFYLGFDIYGLKLWKRQWGETEYGIGALPLGGYVKMLGQEDNPNRLAEEIERSKTPGAPAPVGGDAPNACEIAHAEAALHDPRSYLAKSVPQRMAIISAGVIMNLIFAFFCAMAAYVIGVDYTPSVVGSVLPGQPAWRADIRPGDEVLQIGNIANPRFKQDLRSEVAFGAKDGVKLVIQRPGVTEPINVTLRPDSETQLLPTIGVASLSTNVIHRPRHERDKRPAVLPDSAASRTTPPFQAGDEIISVDGAPVSNSAEIDAILSRMPDKTVQVVVRRPTVKAEPDTPTKPGEVATPAPYEEVKISLPPSPLRTLGLELGVGRITAIQDNSPAASAGLKVGDLITKIDGEPLGDALTLPGRLRDRAGQTVTLTVDRPDQNEPLQLTATLREPLSSDWPGVVVTENMAVGTGALGVAYKVDNKIARVAPDSPAAKAGLAAGEALVSASFLPPEDATAEQKQAFEKAKSLPFDNEHHNGAALFFAVQDYPPGTRVKLVVSKDGQEQPAVELLPAESSEQFNPARVYELMLEPLTATRKADSLGAAAGFALTETKDAVLQVYRFIRGLAKRHLSVKLLGGPISIATAAGMSAFEGPSELLLFLTMLSANLAVVNFLPIPLLDGGHMVLLLWEGIRGKPASERVTIALQYVGLCFILSLMLFVFSLDAGRLMGLDWVMQR